jgi:hypothetical protein
MKNIRPFTTNLIGIQIQLWNYVKIYVQKYRRAYYNLLSL